MMAPKELKAIHPLGKVGFFSLAESGRVGIEQ